MKANEKTQAVLKDATASKKVSKKVSTATKASTASKAAKVATASENILIDSSSLIDGKNLTYRQLKELLPETPKGRMPRTDRIRGEMFVSVNLNGTVIKVFKNGYLTYTENYGTLASRTTVYAVHHCNEIVRFTGFLKSELKEECGSCGKNTKIKYCVVNKQITRVITFKEEEYLDMPWWIAVSIACGERLDQNSEDRFYEKHVVWDPDDFVDEGDGVADPETRYDEKLANESRTEKCERIRAAKEKLPPTQSKILDL